MLDLLAVQSSTTNATLITLVYTLTLAFILSSIIGWTYEKTFLGMMGALSVVRFRTSFKDPRDIMFIFASLGAGIGCGVYAWGAAAGGTIAFCCVAFLLSRTGLGTKHFFDGMLRFALPNEGPVREQVEHIMKTSLKTFILITMREVDGGARLDVAYQVRLRATKPAAEILNELSKLEGISDVQFMMQDATTEM